MKCDIVITNKDSYVITEGERSPTYDLLKDFAGEEAALSVYALTRDPNFKARYSNNKELVPKTTNPNFGVNIVTSKSKFTPTTFLEFNKESVEKSIKSKTNKGFLVKNPTKNVYQGIGVDRVVYSKEGILIGAVNIYDNTISDIQIEKQFRGQNIETEMLLTAIDQAEPGVQVSETIREEFPELIESLVVSNRLETTSSGVYKKDNSYTLKDLFKEAVSTNEALPTALIPSAMNMMVKLKVHNTEALIKELSKLAPNGILDLSESSLLKVFNSYEASEIANSAENKQNIAEIYNKVKSLDIGELEYNPYFAVTNSTETVDGVQMMENPYIEEQNVISAVAGSKDVTDDLPEAYRELYSKDKGFKRYIDYIAENYANLPSYSIVSGEIVPRKSMTPALAERVLKKDFENVETVSAIIEDINYMIETQVPLVVIRKEAMDLSAYISEQGLPINTSKINSIEDVNSLVAIAEELVSNNISGEVDMEVVSDAYNRVQNKSEVIKETVHGARIETDVHIQDTNGMTEIEIMNSFDLIKVAEGQYRKIENIEIKDLVERVKDNYVYGTEGLTDVNEVYEKIVEIGTRSKLSTDASADIFVNTVYKMKDFIPLSTQSEVSEIIKDMPSTELEVQDLMEIEEYIKYQNSDTYPLSIGEQGITYKNLDPISKIRTLIETNDIARDLINYSSMSKGFNYEYTETFIPDSVEDQRFVAYNYPKTVKEYTGEYQIAHDTIAISNLSTPFTRLGDKIYEKVEELNEVAFYKEGPEVRQDFLTSKIERPTTDMEVIAYEYLSTAAKEAEIVKTKTLDNLKC